ncbi:putative oxidoreductase [Cellvibrio sp. BR]|uniref:arsenate reductase (glutaredoxin) n=1 Tax=Cellvibrio sp. BR TaxID=1134474 RepID=UPI0002600E17|nr:arsenate reductase (glutaredoxin) [Cellvibrio sp. BR]EIK44593.1 putative oxidoreductase [Cellvibrio sp. BR]
MKHNTLIALYHNPRCSKSREALNLLREQGVEPEVILYLETPPNAKTLKSLLAQLGISARALLRKSEDAYKELGLADQTLSETALINAMVENPKLIERPIAIKDGKAVIGRPPENVLQLLTP